MSKERNKYVGRKRKTSPSVHGLPFMSLPRLCTLKGLPHTVHTCVLASIFHIKVKTISNSQPWKPSIPLDTTLQEREMHQEKPNRIYLCCDLAAKQTTCKVLSSECCSWLTSVIHFTHASKQSHWYVCLAIPICAFQWIWPYQLSIYREHVG